jgi:error-prone DNA polymerase
LREDEAKAVVDERERNGPYRGLADLASRSGIGRDGLERLAWAGACEALGIVADCHRSRAEERASTRRSGEPPSKWRLFPDRWEESANGASSRRRDLWQLGVARGARREGAGTQLSLPLPTPAPPALRELDSWERMVADYSSTGMTLGVHPMELLRPTLEEELVTSAELRRLPHGTPLRVAGMVTARQRPATAHGVVFMLLEDEVGTVNVVVLPPVYERHRLTVRAASFVCIEGRLERRDDVMNVVATAVRSLATPDLPEADVRQIEPPVERETGRAADAADRVRGAPDRAAQVAAVAPAAHSFGRRGR